MLADYEVEHQAVLTVLRSTGPVVDPLIELMAGLVAKEIRAVSERAEPPGEESVEQSATDSALEPGSASTEYYLAPVASDAAGTAEEWIRRLLGAGVYAVSEKSLGRKVKAGDWVYATATGVVAHARVESPLVQRRHPLVKDPKRFSYVFEVDSVSICSEAPVVLNA
ncbi:MAG: hypothetical protein QHH27_03240 [Clostridia bacterium]|nr:hypothetical protein [Clostridia bacterium]MDH7572551.1 hypothetical protein [Clostridia bacterium]